MSCRRGTPRNDCGCCKSLAEKVRELYQRCANAIKSINGINPDGANNFDILPGAGIQVNPRANGIEIVATGAAPQGMIETINSEGPDSDGNFAITAGSGIQINAGTNGFEIENTSQGAVYTGVSPIEVNADNEISLKDWAIHDTDYTDLFNADVTETTKEMLILIYANGYGFNSIRIPKGTKLQAAGNLTLQYPEIYVSWHCTTTLNIAANLTSSSLQPIRRVVDIANKTTYYEINTERSITGGNPVSKRSTWTGSFYSVIIILTR